MPLVETLPVGDGCAQWSVWGTVARIVVTDPDRLDEATSLVRAELDAVDAACSRFRPDAELDVVARAAGRPIRVSRLLADLVTAAVEAARVSDGDVDPTLGESLIALGYDRDFAAIAEDRDETGPGISVPAHDWRQVTIDGDVLTVPAGIRLDLGATAKAWTADRCAELIARRCDTGVLVALGGDIATAGPAPDGWDVLVSDGPGEPVAEITVPAGAAIATSSTIARSWRRGHETMHHIVDPRTGRPATPTWRTASVVAWTCVAANTMSTGAIVRGDRAPSWLERLDAAARLIAADGSVVTIGRWPADTSPPEADR